MEEINHFIHNIQNNINYARKLKEEAELNNDNDQYFPFLNILNIYLNKNYQIKRKAEGCLKSIKKDYETNEFFWEYLDIQGYPFPTVDDG